MKRIPWAILTFGLILLLAVGLRFYQLGQVPIELNRDEASLGYTAFSLLKTGHEEHGVYWPLNIESFGDWKLPVYVYTLIPVIEVFGLTPWSVRLPSALAGVGIVVMSWLLTRQLGRSFLKGKSSELFPLLVMLLVTISPWDIHLSHLAYEAHLALFLTLVAVYSFILGCSSQARRGQWLVSLAALLFGLTLFTYHSYQIFTPLLAGGLLVIYWPKINRLWSNNKPVFWTAFALAAGFSLLLITTSINANQTKFAALSIFDRKAYLVTMEVNRNYFEDRNSLLAKLHDNYPALLANQIQRNLAALFSTRFFFFDGGTHGAHDIPGTGKLYPIEFLFLILAGYGVLKMWQQRQLPDSIKLTSWWLVVATIAPVITFEAAHTIRFSPALFAIYFFSGLGFFKIVEYWPNIVGKLMVLGTGLILIYSTIYFLSTYFVVSPKRDINNHNWAIKTLIQLVNERGPGYSKILMPGTTWSPYIYFLFYNQVDPATLDQRLEFFPTGSDGFRHVKRLDNIDFSPVDWDELSNPNTLYVIKQQEVPGDKLGSGNYQLEYSLTNEWAKDEWLLISHP